MEKMTRCSTHPGVVFRVTILEEHGISVTKEAKALGLSRTTMSNFCNGHTPCTPDIAQRIALSIREQCGCMDQSASSLRCVVCWKPRKKHVEKLLTKAA